VIPSLVLEVDYMIQEDVVPSKTRQDSKLDCPKVTTCSLTDFQKKTFDERKRMKMVEMPLAALRNQDIHQHLSSSKVQANVNIEVDVEL